MCDIRSCPHCYPRNESTTFMGVSISKRFENQIEIDLHRTGTEVIVVNGEARVRVSVDGNDQLFVSYDYDKLMFVPHRLSVGIISRVGFLVKRWFPYSTGR